MGKYIVTGTRPVFGNEPGETFSKDLTPEEEARHIKRGTIALADGSAPEPEVEVIDEEVEQNNESGDAGERSWS